MKIKRGDVFYADLSPVVGSEQGGVRPVVIIQNDTGNKYSPTVIAAAITSQTNKSNLPTHIIITGDINLPKNSVVLLEQIRTIDKRRLRDKVGELDNKVIKKIDNALYISLALDKENNS
ncbi:MAG: type II toxin-antitoxin system PemK/MazF family toxin [Helcococcus sp.]|nr:type II toxin-antitoxin system PemK/MazF family toxin [Helcococcus sp.]